MKKIIISCFALLLHLYISGQSLHDPRYHSHDPKVKEAFMQEQIEDVKNNAEFVFEGISQKMDAYPRGEDARHTIYVSSYIVKITKVFRGNLKPGTVEIVNGPSVRSSDCISVTDKGKACK